MIAWLALEIHCSEWLSEAAMLRSYKNDEIAGLPFGLAFSVHNWGKAVEGKKNLIWQHPARLLS